MNVCFCQFIELLAEINCLDTSLAQSRADRRRRSRLSGPNGQFDNKRSRGAQSAGGRLSFAHWSPGVLLDTPTCMMPTQPTDDEILLFETRVKTEAMGDLPLVGVYEQGFMALLQSYEHNESFLPHIDHLEHTFSGWRPCLGDGNCFFRAFLCQYLDHLITIYRSNPQVIQAHTELHVAIRKTFQSAGFELFVLEDFIKMYDDLVSLLLSPISNQQEILLSHLNDPEISNALVVYLRMIASAYLRMHPDQYEPFLAAVSPSITSISLYCSHHVEAFGKESDDLSVTALVNALSASVRITALDASHPLPQQYSFDPDQPLAPSNPLSAIQIQLLYRPGHYDILYTAPPQ